MFSSGLRGVPGFRRALAETSFAVAALLAPAACAFAQDTPVPLAPNPVTPATEAPFTGTVPTIGSAALPRDLSPWGMFVNADIVVQVVMVGLIVASLVTWTVWLAKTIEIAAAKRRARAALRVLASSHSLAEASGKLSDARDPSAKLVRTAIDEMRSSADAGAESLKERIAWLLERIEIGAGRRMGRGMGALATIGATAPFVGLFGTVWGIMNSFIGISTAHTTNLAVVAPGIAEALLATALGLFAAIPAVVIYNVFARSIGSYRSQLADAGALVMRLVSRDCERAERLSISLSRAAE
jgi:biopolymer transport protein ExbB